MLLLLLLPPLSLLLPLRLLLASFLLSVHSDFFPMLQSACAYLPYPIEVFDLENLTLLLVILSTYTERFFLMYGDKITIILCFLSLIRCFFFLIISYYFTGFWKLWSLCPPFYPFSWCTCIPPCNWPTEIYTVLWKKCFCGISLFSGIFCELDMPWSINMIEWFILECLYPSSLSLLYAFQQSVMIFESGSLHKWEYLKWFIPVCCGEWLLLLFLVARNGDLLCAGIFCFFSNIGVLRGTNWVRNSSMNAAET